MFIKFHLSDSDKMILIPQHNIRFIQDHEEGGASVYTIIPTKDPERTKTFRTKETIAELYEINRINKFFPGGLFSSI